MTPTVLDINAKLETRYAVPLWLRDEQVRVNTAKVKGRIAPHYDLRDEPIAIACFGPSLNDTWEQIRDYTHVMTCSGAHKFLRTRGVSPGWHVEVDPRAHKIDLVGEPDPQCEYLIASTCHPKYLDYLDSHGARVNLWHVFDPNEPGLRALPAGEWALTGGSSVGLRAMTIARFLGFTDLHVFGMDGCEGATGKHADAHPNQPKGHQLVDYEGVTYRTTTSMLQCAKQTWHELNQMPDVTATFYGEGLVQAMAKTYVPQPIPKGSPMVGYTKPMLISAEYAALNAQLHAENLAYGVGGAKHAPTVLKLATSLKTTSVLDYGAGKGYLAKELPFPIWEYDPAFQDKSVSPRPADIVVCTDVLEHVEPDKIVPVLGDLRRCVKKVGYFVVHTGPSTKVLADGRNSHVLQRDCTWWTKMLSKFFSIGKVIEHGPLLHIVVAPKPKKAAKAA